MTTWLSSLAAALLLATGITSCLSLRNITGPNRVRAVGSVTVSPASATIAVGGSVSLTAMAIDGSGNVIKGHPSSWTSNNTDVAIVSHSGVVSAVLPGSAIITATNGDLSGTSAITVTGDSVVVVPVASVAVTPASDTLAIGSTAQLVATAKDANGSSLGGRTVTWSSDNPAAATVNAGGLVAGMAAGSAHVTATCEGKSGSSSLTVSVVPVASVAVSPASASVAVGATTPLTATAKDAGGNTLGGRTITWSSDNTAAATINSSGVVTGVAAGTAHVTATSEGRSGSSTITVTLIPVASVSLTPTSAGINVGATQQLSATAKDAGGNTLNGRTITWSSDNTVSATVSASGLVRGVAAGTAHVTATCEGQSGSSTITVTLIPVASVSVTPASAGINVGATQQLSAATKDAGGNPLTGRVITWASDNTAAATVSSSGLVRGVVAGSAHVTATCESQSGSSTITVTLVPVASVSVAPASISLPPGATQQLSATPKDAGGSTLTGRVISWSSGNSAVATVSSSGLARGVAAGSATITATCEGKSGTSSCTVIPPSTGGGSFSNCPIFPADNIWNRDISALPVHAMSATWVATLTGNSHLWPSFDSNSYGMKYAVTNGSTPKLPISITGQDPSDSDVPGPYPFTASTPIEVGTPDAHAFMIDTTTCTLYEMYLANWNNGTPQAHAAVIWNLNSNALRADNHSSADEAGLAMFCGLTRWDEVQAGAIRHALRFEATEGHINGTQGAHLWPSRHDSSTPNSNAPPMGARFRLKASYDISGFSPHTQVVLQALKHYGMFLSDVGLDWELVGTVDPNWDTQTINELFTVPTSAFEAVDESSLMIDPNSAQSR